MTRKFPPHLGFYFKFTRKENVELADAMKQAYDWIPSFSVLSNVAISTVSLITVSKPKVKNQNNFCWKNFEISRALKNRFRDNYRKYIRILMEIQGKFHFLDIKGFEIMRFEISRSSCIIIIIINLVHSPITTKLALAPTQY